MMRKEVAMILLCSEVLELLFRENLFVIIMKVDEKDIC